MPHPRRQPAGQRGGQTTRREQQGCGILHRRRQLQRQAELRGKDEIGARIGLLAVGTGELV